MAPPATLPEGTRIGRTALRVTDLEEVVEFYWRVVGLDVLTRGEGETVLGAGSTPLLVVIADERATERARGEVVVPGDGTLEAVRTRLAEGGASASDADGGLETTDPDGIPIRFRTARSSASDGGT